jgi:hypothetical protein
MIVNNDDSCGKANAINHPHYRTCSYMGVLNHPKDMVECVYGIWVNPTVWDFSWYEWYVDNGAKHCLYISIYHIMIYHGSPWQGRCRVGNWVSSNSTSIMLVWQTCGTLVSRTVNVPVWLWQDGRMFVPWKISYQVPKGKNTEFPW